MAMTSPVSISQRFVSDALRRHAVWDVGNEALYSLCRKHPEHRSVEHIVAKVWLIGRSYAAAIERGAEVGDGENIYVTRVAPAMRGARIDEWFEPLQGLNRPDAAMVVPVHARLTRLFQEISGKEKRSLASKYLHFHFPKAVYIFDERVSRGIRLVAPAQHLREMPFEKSDNTYARFYLRCAAFHQELNELMGRQLSPREVDTVLLAVAEP